MNRRSLKTPSTKSCTPIRRILSSCLSALATPSSTGRPLGMVTACSSPPGGVSPPQLRSCNRSSPISSRSSCPAIRPHCVVRGRRAYYGSQSVSELLLVYHASQLRLLFGPVPTPCLELEFANTMLDFYINFINDLNPGRM
jgi:hypothetical protein